MLDSEHVASFVDGHLERAAQDQRPLFFDVTVAGERPNTDAVAERGLSKDEVPIGIGVKIRGRETEHSHGIFWPAGQKHVIENVRTVVLLHPGTWMEAPRRGCNRGIADALQRFHRKAEVDPHKFRRFCSE
jgi:hypothetical protein